MSRKTYTHLTQEERWQIKALKESGLSNSEIGRQLDRSRNTIGEELKRGTLPRGGYSPKRAERAYAQKRAHHGKKRRVLHSQRMAYVRCCLIGNGHRSRLRDAWNCLVCRLCPIARSIAAFVAVGHAVCCDAYVMVARNTGVAWPVSI